jgi:hypothetical protein
MRAPREPEISGRLEENDELPIGTIDLLRYGFSPRRKSETSKPNASWRMAAE